MPVEVKELIIRAVVEGSSKKEEKKNKDGKIDKEEIVTECVDQVLEILKKERER